MPKIILTRGLPASGKSSWARAWVSADPSSRARVNRDDIRFQLYGSYWGDGVDEQVVSKVEEAMVKAAVDAGKDVVIDATHLAARYITRWRKLYPNLTVESFEAPIEELVERDWDRRLRGERGVSGDVIVDMAKRYQIKADGALPALPEAPEVFQWKKATRSNYLASAFIVDIDGTLANHSGVRSPYDTSRYHLDTPHLDVLETVAALQLLDYEMIAVSGRDAAFRDVTLEWLDKHGFTPNYLFMRPEGDTRNDAIVKHELYFDNIDGKFDVVGVFDDRGRVLRMWREIGLTTFAVGDTDNYNF